MGQQLLISNLLLHAESCHGDSEIISRRIEPAQGDERFHRYNWRILSKRARRLANALLRLGVRQDDRVGTLAWNGYRHMELYYAVSGSGAIIHTVNPRLFVEQIAWIINHADDRVIFFDIDLAGLIERLVPLCPSVKTWVAMTDTAHMPKNQIAGLVCYESLLDQESSDFEWPEFDENQAACLCYTSGTTGDPKGALYSHRSTVLHSYATTMPDTLNVSARDVVLPVVPMFHVNAWGLPYTAALVGFNLVLPGPSLDGPSLCELIVNEEVTLSAGVPTVWLAMLGHIRETGIKLPALKRCIVGGSACPPALMAAYKMELGVTLQSSWGMTEMSPLGAVNTLKNKHKKLPDADRKRLELKAGRIPFGVSAKIVDAEGRKLPHDGVAFGDLYVRGPWIISSYYKVAKSPLVNGWLPTGDVATIDQDGFIGITDRSKDVIKSGGEWISSIALENIAMSHPAIAEAAVIAIPHPKWDERPLLIAVKRPNVEISVQDLISHFDGRIAKWCKPDDAIFVAELPHTATGKVHKLKLREKFGQYRPTELA